MPRRNHAWWHVMIGTYCSWLPGDERGFRSKRHSIHSSGDYRNPPPANEHAGLRRYHADRNLKQVEIPRERRYVVAETIANVLRETGFQVWIVSVSAKHAHVLAELPLDLPEFNRVIGLCKSKSSRALRSVLPGRVWARGDKHKLVRDRNYRRNTFKYLRDDQGPGAVSWHLDIELSDD